MEQEGFRYAIRIKANAVRERKLAPWLTRPRCRSSHKPKVFSYNLHYRAGSWDQARRVVVKIAWHAGDMFPRVGFLVTNLEGRAQKVVCFKRDRPGGSRPSPRAPVARAAARGSAEGLSWKAPPERGVADRRDPAWGKPPSV